MKTSVDSLVSPHLLPANFQHVFTSECVQQCYFRRFAVRWLSYSLIANRTCLHVSLVLPSSDAYFVLSILALQGIRNVQTRQTIRDFLWIPRTSRHVKLEPCIRNTHAHELEFWIPVVVLVNVERDVNLYRRIYLWKISYCIAVVFYRGHMVLKGATPSFWDAIGDWRIIRGPQ